MFQLEKDARYQLRALSDNEIWNCKILDDIPAHRMGSLYEYLSAVPDYRSRRGQRYRSFACFQMSARPPKAFPKTRRGRLAGMRPRGRVGGVTDGPTTGLRLFNEDLWR